MPQARTEYLSGQICAVLANIHRTKEARVFEPGDFIPTMSFEEEEEELEELEELEAVQELVDIEAASKAFERMLGKKDD